MVLKILIKLLTKIKHPAIIWQVVYKCLNGQFSLYSVDLFVSKYILEVKRSADGDRPIPLTARMRNRVHSPIRWPGANSRTCTACSPRPKGLNMVSTVVEPCSWERAEGARATSLIPRGNQYLPRTTLLSW